MIPVEKDLEEEDGKESEYRGGERLPHVNRHRLDDAELRDGELLEVTVQTRMWAFVGDVLRRAGVSR